MTKQKMDIAGNIMNKNSTDSKANFRFQGKVGFLTYKKHIPLSEIKKVFQDKDVSISMCHEKGKTKDGYKHTHVLFCYNKKQNIRNSRHWDCMEIHPNFKKVLTNEHWKNLKTYVQKEGVVIVDECKDLTFKEWNSNARKQIQGHKSWIDVINDDSLTYTLQRYLSWAREVWNARPKYKLDRKVKLRAWQSQLIKRLKKQNDRRVMWICDPEGGNGKSFLSNYMIDNCNAFFANNGQIKDVAYAYDNEEYVILDLPRCTRDNDGKDWTPYRLIEMFKDGRLFSSKYQSCLKRFKSAKIVIMANFMPDTSKMSKDRWDIMSLTRGVLAPKVLNINEGTLEEKEDNEKIIRIEQKDEPRISDPEIHLDPIDFMYPSSEFSTTDLSDYREDEEDE